ncbi:MAG: sugar phosphate nucleotidyltransferase [Verrucomicrobiia bacterium]
MSGRVRSAFVLGAGLGTRLGDLTREMPKPLLEVGGRPMVTYGLDHLIEAGVERIIINTHHAAHRWREAFPDGQWRGVPLAFSHEPVLLETGGGLKQVEGWAGGEPLLVYNGDVLTDVSLEPLMERGGMGRLVVLGLRRDGAVRNVEWDAASGEVKDVRDRLGRKGSERCGFTGLYRVEPGFFRFLEAGKIESVVEGFLRAMEAEPGSVGGVLLEGGAWHDLGTREELERVREWKGMR